MTNKETKSNWWNKLLSSQDSDGKKGEIEIPEGENKLSKILNKLGEARQSQLVLELQLQTANEQQAKLKKELEEKEAALQESKKKWFASEQQKVDLMGKVADIHTTQEKLQTVSSREEFPSQSPPELPQLDLEVTELEEAISSVQPAMSPTTRDPSPSTAGSDYDPTAATRLEMPIVGGPSRQSNDKASERSSEERVTDTRYSQRNPEPVAETTTTGKHSSIRDRFPGLAGVSRPRNDSPPRSTSHTQSIPRRQKASKPSLGSISFQGPDSTQVSTSSMQELLDSLAKQRKEIRRLKEERLRWMGEIQDFDRRSDTKKNLMEARIRELENSAEQSRQELYQERSRRQQVEHKLEQIREKMPEIRSTHRLNTEWKQKEQA
jgi:chromosome segregation ATPase